MWATCILKRYNRFFQQSIQTVKPEGKEHNFKKEYISLGGDFNINMFVNTRTSHSNLLTVTTSSSSDQMSWGSSLSLDSDEEFEMMPDLSMESKKLPGADLMESCLSKIKKQCKSLKKCYGKTIKAAVLPKPQVCFEKIKIWPRPW